MPTFRRRSRPFTMWPEKKLSRVNTCSLGILTQAGQQIWSGHNLYKDQQFGFDLWPHGLKFSREHLLFRNNHCIKISNYQASESSDIEGTTFTKIWSLTLTFYPVTWKSIGKIYYLWVLSSKEVKRYWADNPWSTDRLNDWQVHNKIPFF